MTLYRRYRVNRQNQGAFTLIELLVVIAVIALLMGILLPALNLVRNLGKRVVCQNNLHQCVAAMFMYAGDFDDALPIGSIIDRTAPGYAASWDQADQMAMVNAETMRHLGETYGLTEEHATCETARKYFEAKEDWLEPREPSPQYTQVFQIGWIYWGARGRWTDPDTNQEYVTARKLSDRATSGPWPAWYSSHVKGQFFWNQGVPFDPKPDGLGVGYLDGSCRFVKWNELSPSNHAGQYIVYYDPTY